MPVDRRRFLVGGFGATVLASWPVDFFADQSPRPPAAAGWDSGQVRHLLPTVSDTGLLNLARATQRLYYPEFLPDATRPSGLPWSSSGDRETGLSESFGTLRFGRLAEVLLYDVRRTMTLAGASAVFVDVEVERWLRDRTSSTDATHLVHAPSNPPGWSAG